MSTKRPDISKFLIHLTRPKDDEEKAYQNLKSIVERRSIEKSKYRVGGENIVCFTETPIGCIKSAGGLLNYTNYTRYSCFGIVFYKSDIYLKEGRPVLYMEEKYYQDLPEPLKWRFEKFEPTFSSVKFDFTWEREWRVISDYDFQNDYYEVIVPSIEWGERLKQELDNEQIEIYDDCRNSKIAYLNYDELCDNTCELDIDDCPPPEEFDKSIICIDGTC